MTTREINRKSPESGFSLTELMMVMIIMIIVMGAVFQVISLSTERSSTEQTKLDMFQEAREFMDQMSRDLRQAGYPNPRNVEATSFTQIPRKNDPIAAAGIVKVDSGDLWFEADVEGLGTVSVIRYHLDTSTANGCPCLKRSQLPKIIGDPVTGQSTEQYQVQVQGVQNTDIFTAWANAAPISLPKDLGSDPAEMESMDTIQARLSLRAMTMDPKTRQYPSTTLVATVKLNNCTQAVSMSCR